MEDDEFEDDYTEMWDRSKNEYWLERDLEDDEDLDPWDECNEEEEDE